MTGDWSPVCLSPTVLILCCTWISSTVCLSFGGYDSCLVVTCVLTRFTCAFPWSKKITGEQTVKILVEQWVEHYGASKEVHSDEDVRIRSDTGWYKRALDALNVHVTTRVPYTHTYNPLCETQNRVLEQHLRTLMRQERTKD